MRRKKYDLVVIGAGPAGEKGAAQAAYFGKRVAIVERQAVGGAGCNTGTLPSKTLRETALMLSGLRARDLYGVDLSLRRDATVHDFLWHERRVTSSEQAAVRENLQRHRVDVYPGVGAFEDPHTIRIDSAPGEAVFLEAEKILITAGSSPARPDTFPFDHSRVWDSDDVLEMEFMPKRLVVVGAGVIGSEYACTFAALGIQVTLVDSRSVLLPLLDGDLREVLERQMRTLGIQPMMGERVRDCRAADGCVTVELESGMALTVDAVLVAAGRRGNIDSLALDRAGITPGDKGTIPVNEHYQTAVPHIYAAGDIVGFPALASTSMEQARVAMVHAFDLKYKRSVGPVLPMGIFTIPEVSVAGQTEQDMKRQGTPYVIGRAYYGGNPRGRIIGDTEGVLKLIFREADMGLAGVGIVGEGASELVHVGLMALMAGATSEMFIEACFNYPTLGQLYKYATYDAMGARAAGAEG